MKKMKPETLCTLAVLLMGAASFFHGWASTVGVPFSVRVPLACLAYYTAFRMVSRSHHHDPKP